MIGYNLGEYSKGVVALIGALVTIGAVAFGAEQWFQQVIAVLTALGVYAVPNASGSDPAV